MEKIAIIYWSGTGNTQKMATAIAEGINETSAACEVFSSNDFPISRIADFNKIAFGCPAMGAEELESGEFEPLFNVLLPHLAHKKIALFGSYDWGDGEWMRIWQNQVVNESNAVLFDNKGFIVHNTPAENDLHNCKNFGLLFAQS